MNIAIIEKGHFEGVYPVISLFDTGENNITIFIDKASFKQLEYLLLDKTHKYTWIVQDEESNRDFIKLMFDHIHTHSFDILYFNTISDNFIHYARQIKRLGSLKVILTLHDILGYFRFAPSFSIRRIIRYIGKKELIKSVQNFNVVSDTLIPLLKEKIPVSKTIFNVPGAFFDPAMFIPARFNGNEIIKIAVPGSVDSRRRNNDAVFELLEAARVQHINISITLLGGFSKMHGKKIYERCRKYLQSGTDLHIYETDIVSQQEFDRVMTESHFTWIPVQEYATVTDGTTEQYGISITTGSIYDVIRHCRPFFAPAFFKIETALETGCLRYRNTTDIIGTLWQLNETAYTQMQRNAFDASMYYTKEKIISRNKKLFG